MTNLSEDALICDLAETYHIYDYRSLPLRLVATLSAGLRNDSRIKLLAADMPASQETLLLAIIADRIAAFHYGFSKDAKGGKEPPKSMVDALMGSSPKKKNKGALSFRTAAEFEAMRAKIIGE